MKVLCLLALLGAVHLPAAEYSTYLGGSNSISISKIISDPAGNVYVAGSRTFPSNNNLSEAIMMKLDGTGKTVLSAALSGKGTDVANAVAVDGTGNIYLAGQTTSPDFPVHNALFSTPPVSNPSYVGFIAKFSPDASQVLYSTYFPGLVNGIVTDAAGNLYVTGTTASPAFPLTAGLPAGRPASGVFTISGAFLTKISPSGDRLLYSTVFTGVAKDCGCCSSCFVSDRGATGTAVALDAADNAYIAGNSNVSDLPATPGALLAQGVGAFVAKVNTAGTALVYLTYLGSGHQTISPFLNVATGASALAVDSSGNAFVVGSTWDPQLPVTPGAFQTSFHGWSQIGSFAATPPNDAFVFKLNPTGTAVVWGSYLGGAGEDNATAATLDSAGNLWVAGTTKSTDFPNVQGWSTGGDFIVEFNAAGSLLPYSARYPDLTASHTLAIDSAGLLHVASQNALVSAVAAVPRPAIRPWAIGNAATGTLGGQVAAGELVAIYGPHIGAFPAQQSDNSTGFVPSALGGSQVFFDDRPAPLLYSSDGQINAVVPFEVAGQATTRVRIANQGATGPEFTAMVLYAIPQVFRNTVGYAAALNQDGTINSADNPAKIGSVVSIWVTGVSTPYPPIPDGQIVTDANNYACCLVYTNFSFVYPIAATYLKVSYAGTAPGMVAGVAQINVEAPASGVLVVGSAGAFSDPVSIYVTP